VFSVFRLGVLNFTKSISSSSASSSAHHQQLYHYHYHHQQLLHHYHHQQQLHHPHPRYGYTLEKRVDLEHGDDLYKK